MHRLACVVIVVAIVLAAAGATPPPGISAPNARDGSIAFVRQGDIYVIAAEGGRSRRLEFVPRIRSLFADGPAWSSDGKKLAFGGHYPYDTLNLDSLFVSDAAGHARSLGDTGRGEAGVSWSPDGKQIVVGSGGDEPEVWRTSVTRRGNTRLADGFDPAWSPDGAWIAYRFGSGSLCSSGTCTLKLHGIALIRPNGTGERRLSRLGGDPSWSPDGQQIAFTHLRRAGDIFTEMKGGTEDGICVMNSDGSHLQRLTTRRGDRDPAWSPSGSYIAFTRGSTTRPSVWIMRRDGSGQHLLVANAERPAWQPLP